MLLSLVMFALLYALLFVLFLFLLNGKIQEGPAELETVETRRAVFRPPRPPSASSRSRQGPVRARRQDGVRGDGSRCG